MLCVFFLVFKLMIYTRGQSLYIIKIQSLLRMYQEKCLFFNKKNAILLIQYKWKQFDHRDPISLQRIGIPFVLRRHSSTLRLDACVLHAYIEATGDLCDPTCRVPYSSNELKRLDALLPNSNPLSVRTDILHTLRETIVMRHSLCEAFEREIYNSINCLKLFSEMDAIIMLQTDTASMIMQSFGNMCSLDVDFSKTSIESMITFVKYDFSPETPRLSCAIVFLLEELMNDL